MEEKTPKLVNIDPAMFECGAFRIWGDDWLVLAAGDFAQGSFNAMTVGWGFFGTLWARPAVMIMVRPQRWTLRFLEQFDTFTLSAFDASLRPALGRIGKVSGRDVPDKLQQAGLTPVAASRVAAPGFEEAELVIECRKLYRETLAGKNFLDKSLVGSMYPERDYHVCFFGEVLAIRGTGKYMKL